MIEGGKGSRKNNKLGGEQVWTGLWVKRKRENALYSIYQRSDPKGKSLFGGGFSSKGIEPEGGKTLFL